MFDYFWGLDKWLRRTKATLGKDLCHSPLSWPQGAVAAGGRIWPLQRDHPGAQHCPRTLLLGVVNRWSCGNSPRHRLQVRTQSWAVRHSTSTACPAAGHTHLWQPVQNLERDPSSVPSVLARSQEHFNYKKQEYWQDEEGKKTYSSTEMVRQGRWHSVKAPHHL